MQLLESLRQETSLMLKFEELADSNSPAAFAQYVQSVKRMSDTRKQLANQFLSQFGLD